MKKDIKYLQRFINRCKKCGSEFYGILKPGHFESLQNLINKYKEQEAIITALKGANVVLNQELKTEKEKLERVIELMAEAIHDYEDWTDTVCNIMDCSNTPHCKAETKEQELNCIIKYFKKKARGE